MAYRRTKHFEQRIRQRGFTSGQIEAVLSYGVCTRSGYFMSRNRAAEEIDIRNRRIRALRREIAGLQRKRQAGSDADSFRWQIRKKQEEITHLQRDKRNFESSAGKRMFLVSDHDALITAQRARKRKVRRELRH